MAKTNHIKVILTVQLLRSIIINIFIALVVILLWSILLAFPSPPGPFHLFHHVQEPLHPDPGYLVHPSAVKWWLSVSKSVQCEAGTP